MIKSFKSLDPRDIERRLVSLASHNVSVCFPNLFLPSNSLNPFTLTPHFSQLRPARRSRLSPPSSTLSPAPGAKGLLALPIPILYRIVSFITRPCPACRFCSSWTRRPVYKSTLTAFATTSIYLLLALQYHIDLPPGFLSRKVKPKEKELPANPCCEVGPEESKTRIESMAAKLITARAKEEHEMRVTRYQLCELEYDECFYTLGQLEAALERRILEELRLKPAISVRQWIEKLLEPYPHFNGPKVSSPDKGCVIEERGAFWESFEVS